MKHDVIKLVTEIASALASVANLVGVIILAIMRLHPGRGKHRRNQ